MKGKFITFEGCEGVGKSRQLQMLGEYLDKNGINHYFTREPGGEPISEKIRNIILDKENAQMADECEALLYAASRVQLLSRVIKPKLDAGELVICDRYFDSSFAYQSYARGISKEFVEGINQFAIKNFTPDYTIFLNLSPEEAFKRKGGVDATDRVELSGMEFHKKVYEGYLAIARENPERVIVIDASGSRWEPHEKILNALKEKGTI